MNMNSWTDAINIMIDRQHINLTDEQAALYEAAAAAIVRLAFLPDDAFDWIMEGDYDGTETPRRLREEWRELESE